MKKPFRMRPLVKSRFETIAIENSTQTLKGDEMKLMQRMILPLVLLFGTTALQAGEKEITVQLTVPDSAWTLAIDEVYRVGNEFWVISIVSQNQEEAGAQVISTVWASVNLAAPDLPIKNFIIGKVWNWENPEPYTFINDIKQIEKELKSGKLLYKAEKQSP